MGSKKIRPITPGMRGHVTGDFSEITKSKPEKKLLQSKKSTGGRNNKGRITSRHRGGGHKQKYRVVDFKRVKDGIPAKVAGIELTQTEIPELLYFIMLMAKKVTLLHLKGFMKAAW